MSLFTNIPGKSPTLVLMPNKKDPRSQFKDRILSKNGLPIVFLNNREHTYVMLLDLPMKNIAFCRIVLISYQTVVGWAIPLDSDC